MKELKEKLKFETFTEFCERADEILESFKLITQHPKFSISEYKNYIYHAHRFSKNNCRDLAVKDKIFEYLMSYKYEYVSKEELYMLLGQIQKGK